MPRYVFGFLYYSYNRRNFTRRKETQFFSNISKSKLSSLTKLSRDKSIIIKKADKSNTIVIMNRDDYKTEVLRQLGDKKYYEKLDEDPSQSVMQNINKCMDKIKLPPNTFQMN